MMTKISEYLIEALIVLLSNFLSTLKCVDHFLNIIFKYIPVLNNKEIRTSLVTVCFLWTVQLIYSFIKNIKILELTWFKKNNIETDHVIINSNNLSPKTIKVKLTIHKLRKKIINSSEDSLIIEFPGFLNLDCNSSKYFAVKDNQIIVYFEKIYEDGIYSKDIKIFLKPTDTETSGNINFYILKKYKNKTKKCLVTKKKFSKYDVNQLNITEEEY